MTDRRPRYRTEFEMLVQSFLHLNDRYDADADVLLELNRAMERSDDAEVERIRCRLFRRNGICDTLALIHVAETGLRMIYDPQPSEIQTARVGIIERFQAILQQYNDQRDAARNGLAGCLTCAAIANDTEDGSVETAGVALPVPTTEAVAQPLQGLEPDHEAIINDLVTPPSYWDNRLYCLYCRGDHGLCKCHVFRYELTGQQRRRFADRYIAGRGGCVNCFRTTHQADQCRYTDCKRCKRAHNSLLCPLAIGNNERMPRPSGLPSQTTGEDFFARRCPWQAEA